MRCSQQHQTCDIAAGDRQHQPKCSEQKPQRRPRVPDKIFVQRYKAKIRRVRVPGRFRGIVPDQYLQFRARPIERNSRLQTPDTVQEVHERPETRIQRAGFRWPRNPHINAGERKLEAVGQNADDRMRDGTEQHLLTDRRSSGAKALPPQIAADHCDSGSAVQSFIGKKAPAQRWIDTQNTQEVGRHSCRNQRLGLADTLAEINASGWPSST